MNNLTTIYRVTYNSYVAVYNPMTAKSILVQNSAGFEHALEVDTDFTPAEKALFQQLFPLAFPQASSTQTEGMTTYSVQVEEVSMWM